MRKTPAGISLVELLVVIAIIVALFGLVMPVLVSARIAAKVARDSSNLHQLGLAAELYSQSTEKLAWSPLDFKTQPEWNSPIWQSPLDQSRKGFRNNLLEWLALNNHPQYQTRIVPFPVSYVALADFLSDDHIYDTVKERQGAGWLVDFRESLDKDAAEPGKLLALPYTRLCLDTSVKYCRGRPKGTEVAVLWLFCDPTEEEKSQDLK